MMRNFKQILDKAQGKGRKRLAVPHLGAAGYIKPLKWQKKPGLIIPVPVGALDEAIAMARNGEVDLLFQGDAEMAEFIDALTVKGTGIAERKLLSYVSIFELPSENRLIMLTDTLIQTFPDIRRKVRILENAIGFAGILGIEKPNIAALSTVELVNFHVPSSVDAAVLSKMSERRQLKGLMTVS